MDTESYPIINTIEIAAGSTNVQDHPMLMRQGQTTATNFFTTSGSPTQEAMTTFQMR